MSNAPNHRRGHGRISNQGRAGCGHPRCGVCHPEKVLDIPPRSEAKARIAEREQREDPDHG